jgi:hypothetical protein
MITLSTCVKLIRISLCKKKKKYTIFSGLAKEQAQCFDIMILIGELLTCLRTECCIGRHIDFFATFMTLFQLHRSCTKQIIIINIKDWTLWSVPSPELQLLDNIHKSWATPSDITSLSSVNKSEFLTSSLVIPGQCNFGCSKEERVKASSQRLKTENFG